MELTCPGCHRHQFKSTNFLLSRSGGDAGLVYCPYCGGIYSLDKKSGNIINLITFSTFFGYIAFAIWLMPTLQNAGVIAMAFGGVALASVVRVLAIGRLGKIARYKVKHSEPYPRIRLSDVKGELAQLNGSRKFIVLYAPDESAYLSFGLQKGSVFADLAFAVGKFEALEPIFRSAAMKIGAIAKPYHKRGMRGIEADLGSDREAAAHNVEVIMREMFNLKPDAEVAVMRDS